MNLKFLLATIFCIILACTYNKPTHTQIQSLLNGSNILQDSLREIGRLFHAFESAHIKGKEITAPTMIHRYSIGKCSNDTRRVVSKQI